MQDISRRFFIGGLASFGAFGGCRFFNAPRGTYASGVPNLKFGVVSDIHITHIGAHEKPGNWGNNLTFRHTLEWFRDQGVDAVMIVGDMADCGMVRQLEAVAEAWYRVFPNDCAPDGRRIEKLFVHGNHDYHGFLYGDHAKRVFAREVKDGRTYGDWAKDHVLRANMAASWRRIFHEDYATFYTKEVKGYTFLGQHWDDGTDMSSGYGTCDFGASLAAWLAEHGKSVEGKRPFFYFQHPHPKDTCYGSWAWGHDTGKTTAVLSHYANAIAFSGHSHYSLTDERSIWQGGFTSVGTSSLRYTGSPYDERRPLGYENTSTEARNGAALNALKMMDNFETADCRQGMLWHVYEDRIVVQRREFLTDQFVGDDWVMPLPAAESKPFDFAARAAKATPPSFAPTATLKVLKTTAKTRRGIKDHPSVEKPAYKLMWTPALSVCGSRPYAYEVMAYGQDGAQKDFHMMAPGFNHAVSHKKLTAEVTCILSADRMPAGLTRFEVRAYDCWHNRSEPISAVL